MTFYTIAKILAMANKSQNMGVKFAIVIFVADVMMPRIRKT
ncbi:MAG: hypothetical protein PHY70_06240 [Methanocellales archaeon]|nr:hypothetical protein [Methanocellales archaeon]